MMHPIRNRSRLMLGCGSAALALALAMAPKSAQAQGIDATGAVVVGSAEITDLSPTETLVEVFDPTVVIDWTPNENAAGDAADFIRTGALARFEGPSLTNFAVLNRILPSTNGNIAVIDGTVISRVLDPNSGGLVPGGFVAFYSPTGMLIGSNATFDVGSLMLTTLNITDANFQNFASNGFMQMQGATGSTARIQINPGAQITALAENSFFAVVAADVQMLGTARINGSHAYVAGEVVNLSFSNGLFNISVPVGTADSGTVMELNGNIGGPSSNGGGDNHMIYAVAAAQADPISMIFRGNLGFDPAQSAGIVNGEIILSANHNVFGRTVDGGNISDGINAVFGANSATSNVRADIFMEDFNASSSVLAISTHRTQVTAFNNDSSVLGNLLMVGRQNAELTASNGQNFIISGDVLVSAQDYGVVSSSLQSLDEINATGGVAFIDAFGGGNMNIGGNVLVAADAFAGAEDLSGIAGSAQAGQALIGSTGGTLNIDGNATVSARGVGTNINNVQTGATVRGGLAQFFSVQGGQVSLGGNLDLSSDAIGAQGSLFGASSVSNAFGGTTLINVFNGAGSITIDGEVFASASAFGGSANTAGAGSLADAGSATVSVDGAGTITIVGQLQLDADGTGGNNAGGIGGTGLGGRASVTTFNGGTINIGAAFNADAVGLGGNGLTGGDGFGGIAGANAITGAITLSGGGFVTAAGLGGNATFGFGGNGGLGRGGNAFFQANGTLTATASLEITGDALAFAQGVGGNGGVGDGSVTPAGRGGDGYGGQFTVPNQADANFGSGAFILAGGDNGTLSITGQAYALATGFGGDGGNGGSVGVGGRGGDAFGGLAQVGMALLGQNGSLGQGTASFSSLLAEAEAFGGRGGFSIGDFPTGNGGDATGGNAFLTVRAGDVTADSITLDTDAFGGEGANGGIARGGIAALLGSLGGSLTTDALFVSAIGSGGFGGGDITSPGNGGDGFGGEAELDFQGITVQVNGDVRVDAEGYGGGTSQFTAGNGTGGIARVGALGTVAGSGTITGNTVITSNGFGGSAGSPDGGQSGDGFGGTSSLQALSGGTVTLTTVQVMANGFGGQGEGGFFFSGDGTGGNADITATGTGSQITIIHNVTTQQFNQQNFGAILSATGVGGLSTFGTGAGGTGRGGTALVAASAGGSVALPADPLNDPDSVGFIRLFARGFGGNSTIVGGAGGTSFGGNVNIDVDGGSLTMGETVLSSFTQGGTAQGDVADVTGGNAFAGSRRVSIRNGGTATLNLIGGGAGAQGGTGTGTANGGNAYIGQNLFEIVNASATIIGQTAIFDQSQGGNGRQGGSVFNVNPFTGLRGSLNIVLDNANITFTPDASGVAGIGGDFVTRGGNGVVRGGDAQGPDFNVTINQTNLTGGQLRINPFIQGGDASAIDGIGGSAFGSLVNIAITNSQLTLPGETLFAADALGGAGGANGTGGSGTSGAVDVTITGSTLNLIADQQGVPGALRLSALGSGRLGGQVGDGTSNRAVLNLVNSAITATQVQINAQGSAGASGGLGGDAIGGQARLSLAGTSTITADLLSLNSSASTGQGGTATGGVSAIDAGTGATATLTVPQVVLSADGLTSANDLGGIAGTTQGGQSRIGASGGSLTITGNAIVNANATGAIAGSILTGAVARAGQARVFASEGGSLSIGGNLTVAADAFGSRGSLGNASSVSDAFGGFAALETGEAGGTISIGGFARISAGADGGSSNNAGVGSRADGGTAVANINNGGLITVTGQLLLNAPGRGGENSGGIGGTGLGGRASAAVFNGGTLRMLGGFNTVGEGFGGDGRVGGDGFGGITGANAIIGTIAITGDAFIGSTGLGGDASYGSGGAGGLGRGGNAFLQANGTLTATASLTVSGNATVIANGFGGRGGDGNGGTIAAGRGGDGIGGQFSVPNQADPTFNSGAYILAGGDNGTISVGGEAVARANGTGGNGGIGIGQQAGGNGGNGFGGLAQVGLALLGQNGSLGQGSATFRRVLGEAFGFGGNGGITDVGGSQLSGADKGSLNSGIARTGNGGSGTGGGAFITVRAGDITATQIDLFANGTGGEGALAGTGTGGEAALFGGLGGTITATGVNFSATGFGGGTFVGTGGNGIGGTAAIEGDGITVTINGNAVVTANGSGGEPSSGAGGDGTGGEAYISAGTVNSGTITITGHAQANAFGFGGGTITAFAAGNGRGGNAFIEALGGSTVTLGSAQVQAVGRGGSALVHEGGNGTGGSARVSAVGTGSSLIIQRNVPSAIASTTGSATISANGLGGNTRGGDGVGGTGLGGTVDIFAGQGGSIALPTNIANDPNAVNPFVSVTANGFGGGSSVEGGVGGEGFGGDVNVLADNGTITMGLTTLSNFAQGGNSLDTARNITGGDAAAGDLTVRVINSGSLTAEFGGNVFARGGNGSGTGNGGAAQAGTNLLEVIDSIANFVGNVTMSNQALGGNGLSGGSATGGTLTFNASNASINQTANANGNAALSLTGTITGGAGTSSGGDAVGATANVSILNSTISGGRLVINPSAVGGASSGSSSGSALGSQVQISITGSQLNLVGESLFAAEARGGAGSNTADGGGASGGTVTFTATDSVINLLPDSGGVARLAASAAAFGGASATVGASAQGGTINFALNATTLAGGSLAFNANATGGESGTLTGNGGFAQAGSIQIDFSNSDVFLAGDSLIEASARGGNGEVGGNATAGDVTMVLNNTTMEGGQQLRLASQSTAGRGVNVADVSQVGDATSGNVILQLIDSSLNVPDLILQANSTAESGIIEVAGGSATAGTTLLRVSGDSEIFAGSILQQSDAITSFGQRQGVIGFDQMGNPIIGTIFDFSGDTAGGFNRLWVEAGSTALIDTQQIRLGASTEGGGQNIEGRFSIEVLSGEVNTQFLIANTSFFDTVPGASPSQVVVRGGRLLAQNAELSTSGILNLITSDNGVIGSDGTSGTSNFLQVTAGDTITVSSDATTGGVIGGQNIYIESGRSLILDDANIVSPDGVVTLIANGCCLSFSASPGIAEFTMSQDARINAGTGSVTIEMRNGNGNTVPAPNIITLGDINAGRIAVFNSSSFQGSDIRLREGGTLTASGTGRAIDLAAFSGNVIDENTLIPLTPSSGLLLTGDGHFGIFAESPEGSSVFGVAPRNRRYNVNADNYGQIDLGSGVNFAAYRIRPVLTITAADLVRLYGDPNPDFSAIISGFLAGDDASSLTGSPIFSTSATQFSNVGNYDIQLSLGSLTSVQGYQIVLDPLTGGIGTLTIDARPITITADSFSRIYGNANPALTFTVGGLGLVNGDQLTGDLETLADATTGVGNYAITQGSLSASSNYAVTFIGGTLTIDPRALIVTANDLSRIYGNANPALTFTISGDGLVNGDQLSGALATAAGQTTGVGNVAITQGTLSAGPNYALTFVNGQLTITPRPLTLIANSFSRLFGLPDPQFTFQISGDGLINGDQLTGALVRDPGEAIGNYAIRQGTLTAGDNYAIDFVNGQLTIDPPPAPDVLNSTTIINEPLQTGEDPPVASEEEEERFGMDFPEQPDAPLISEDPLLDDPVTSGGDASLYSGGGVGNPGSEDN